MSTIHLERCKAKELVLSSGLAAIASSSEAFSLSSLLLFCDDVRIFVDSIIGFGQALKPLLMKRLAGRKSYKDLFGILSMSETP
jgi:hypothetical protein